jgi:hypothetical protein
MNVGDKITRRFGPYVAEGTVVRVDEQGIDVRWSETATLNTVTGLGYWIGWKTL